ncbi:MAG: hypothetical protein GEU73_15805, partial [Chloroflexi bacterium]|nr:hypothetical protein [Chloroflexota bacterium]
MTSQPPTFSTRRSSTPPSSSSSSSPGWDARSSSGSARAASRSRSPGGECYRQVVDRVHDFLSDVARSWVGTRIIVIGHSATRWALNCLLLGAFLEARPQSPVILRSAATKDLS